MAREQVWFNLPQVVVLTATRDLTLKVVASNPDLLLVKANQILGERDSVPLDAEPGTEAAHKAIRQLREESSRAKNM